MSAQGRGAPGIPQENYSTPAWCVRRLLEVAPWRDGATWPRSPRILEPCAGEGAIVRVLRAWYPMALIDAGDVRDTRDSLHAAGADRTAVGDATDMHCNWWRGWGNDLVITNTPFSLWQDFAARGLESTRWLALLLRLGALAHLGELPTPSVYVLPDRPNFVALWKCVQPDRPLGSQSLAKGCGWQAYYAPHDSTKGQRCPSCGGKVQRTSSDSSEYAWFVWGPQAPCVHILAKTSLEERKQ